MTRSRAVSGLPSSRASCGTLGGAGGGVSDTAEILRLAGQLQGPTGGPVSKDAAFREKLAEWYVQSEGLKNGRMRTITALSRGQTPGPESSIGKVVVANQMLLKVRRLLQANLNLYAAHLALDAHPEVGNNVELARLLDLTVDSWFCNVKGADIGVICGAPAGLGT